MTRSKAQETLAPLPWADNDHAAVWKLVGLLGELENCRKLFGKDPSENTSGDTKFKIYGAIARSIWPQHYDNNSKTVTTRTKAKAEWLQKLYSRHLARLRKAGEGVGNADEGTAVNSECLVPADGPDQATSQHAVNLWNKIHNEFPWFGASHHILSSQPNIVPPAIVTGIGPAGREIIYNNPPPPSQECNPNIDPALYNLSNDSTPPPPARSECSPGCQPLTPTFSQPGISPGSLQSSRAVSQTPAPQSQQVPTPSSP